MLFCLACNTVPENWHTCVNKGLIYLNVTFNSIRHLSITFPKTLDIYRPLHLASSSTGPLVANSYHSSLAYLHQPLIFSFTHLAVTITYALAYIVTIQLIHGILNMLLLESEVFIFILRASIYKPRLLENNKPCCDMIAIVVVAVVVVEAWRLELTRRSP